MATVESLVGYYQLSDYQYGQKKMGVFFRDEQGCTKMRPLLLKEGTIDEAYEASQERCFGSHLTGVPELVLDCAVILDFPSAPRKPIYVVNAVHFGSSCIIHREGMEDIYFIRLKKFGARHFRLEEGFL